MTPVGSGLIALWLSQGDDVGWLWNSQSEFEVAAKFASVGILFYTGAFAILEAGVLTIMVLALKALESYEKRKEQRRREHLKRAAQLLLEAHRRNKETGEPVEAIFEQLLDENWQPD